MWKMFRFPVRGSYLDEDQSQLHDRGLLTKLSISTFLTALLARWPKCFFVKPAETRTVTLKQLIAVFSPVNKL